MKAYVAKTPDQFLIPFDDYSAKAIGRIGDGEIVQVEIKRQRNAKNHAKFFALIRMLYNEIEAVHQQFRSEEHLRFYLEVQAGFYDTVTMPDGEVKLMVRSIAWDETDEDEFKKLFSSIVDHLVNDFLPQYTKDDLMEMTDRVIRLAPTLTGG